MTTLIDRRTIATPVCATASPDPVLGGRGFLTLVSHACGIVNASSAPSLRSFSELTRPLCRRARRRANRCVILATLPSTRETSCDGGRGERGDASEAAT